VAITDRLSLTFEKMLSEDTIPHFLIPVLFVLVTVFARLGKRWLSDLGSSDFDGTVSCGARRSAMRNNKGLCFLFISPTPASFRSYV
jgi:hypothetical protein